MANEIVKYNNDLNTANMREWTSEEMNFFFTILTKAKNKGTDHLIFDSYELRALCKFSNKHIDRWFNTMISCTKKISQMTYWEKCNGTFEIMTLFSKLKVDSNKGTVEVQVSPHFEYILNKFDDFGFTYFGLSEFVSIRSTYAKQMYRQIKQWKKAGYIEYGLEQFKYLMSIPENYRTCDIDARVLKPIIKELGPIFDLKVKPIKKKTKGNPVIGYAFKWTPERTNTWIEGQPQPNPNKPKKAPKSTKTKLPEWYEKTEGTKPSQELLEEVKALQKATEEPQTSKRQLVLGYVKKHPGATVSEIKEATGVDSRTIRRVLSKK